MIEPDDRVLVAVSGGKDSLALWSILLKLGFQADGLYIDLGITGGSGYSERSRQYAQVFADTIFPKAKLHVLDVRATWGKSTPEMAGRGDRGRKRFRSACGLVKRHEMNRAARELGYTVLATGHNLDDEAAVLLGNVLNWETEYMVRQFPVLPASGIGLIKKVKPLARFYERETAAYSLVSGIEYILDECPFSTGATSLGSKEILNTMENRSPGTKLKFYFDFLRAKKKGLFPANTPVELHPCEKCGEATGASGPCAFCRLLERHRQA
ncbi:MAG: ATP-binding protein [Syntrophobacteraceae bacterium]